MLTLLSPNTTPVRRGQTVPQKSEIAAQQQPFQYQIYWEYLTKKGTSISAPADTQ